MTTGLIVVAAAAMSTAGGRDTRPDLDIVIQSTDFTKGTVKRVEKGGWADGESVILCDNRSPDWAEWPVVVPEHGLYEVYARFAAQDPRPVQLRIDDHVVAPEACAQTTGSWKSSTARWFPVGHAVIGRGDHVLRMWRQTCIPHIVAFGFAYRGPVERTGGLFDLPADMRTRDHYTKQDWMIWTIGGIQDYRVQDGAYTIVNGEHVLNRPLYGTNGPDTVFAGDRPLLLFSRGPDLKLGLLRIGIETGETRAWLHETGTCRFAYDGATVEWEVDGVTDAGRIRVSATCLPEDEGTIVRLEAPRVTRVVWWYGGLRDGYPDNRAGHGAMPLGDPLEDARGNQVTAAGKTAVLADPRLAGTRVHVGTTAGAWAARQEAESVIAEAGFTVSGEPAALVVSTSAEAVKIALADPPATWRNAVARRRQIARRLTVATPDPVLDAAMQSNNAAMDGQYRPPSFLHGALRWGTECGGWYLGWRGWYGPIVAGDWERVLGAAVMHAGRQFDESAGRLNGKVANFVTFDRDPTDTKTGYNMQEVFLDHLRCYYHWTGDDDAMRRLWPCIAKALEFQRREIGRDLDGLYTNAVNTWISDGHHYNGNACTQASAYAVSHNRFAAQVAALVGEDPAPYREHAQRTRQQMRERLWLARKGIYAEYVDGDGAAHDAAEAPTVYHAVEMGAADAFEAYQLTRYVDTRLWRFGDQILANDWFPVIVTNGLIGFNESLNTALAYYLAGRYERAWRLLRVCSESTRRAAVPGSISCYGSRQGEQGTYVDFTDATSMFARTVVEGLFGLRPRVDEGVVEWSPGFPNAWDHAALTTRGFALTFERRDGNRRYSITSDKPLKHRLRLPLAARDPLQVTVNGQSVEPVVEAAVGRPFLVLGTDRTTHTEVVVSGSGTRPTAEYPRRLGRGRTLTIRIPDARIVSLADPQSILADTAVRTDGSAAGRVVVDDGWHTVFAEAEQNGMRWWEPVDLECVPPLECLKADIVAVPGIEDIGLRVSIRNNSGQPLSTDAVIRAAGQEMPVKLKADDGETQVLEALLPDPGRVVPGGMEITIAAAGMSCTGKARLWRIFSAHTGRHKAFVDRCRMLDIPRNDTLADIFTRDSGSQNGVQLNNWTWYKTEVINTEAMRSRVRDGVLHTGVGVPFAVSETGHDGMVVSRWEPFPRDVTVPVAPCRGDRLYLLLANHTHNSQTHMVQARVDLHYEDGSRSIVPLRCPDDVDGMLQHYSDMAPEWLGGRDHGWYGHGRASGVHADVTDIAVDPDRTLVAFRLVCVTEETLVGLLGATVHLAGAE